LTAAAITIVILLLRPFAFCRLLLRYDSDVATATFAGFFCGLFFWYNLHIATTAFTGSFFIALKQIEDALFLGVLIVSLGSHDIVLLFIKDPFVL